jgi:hypothetical protein
MCQRCHHLFIQKLSRFSTLSRGRLTDENTRFQSMRKLDESATRGCATCQMVLSQLDVTRSALDGSVHSHADVQIACNISGIPGKFWTYFAPIVVDEQTHSNAVVRTVTVTPTISSQFQSLSDWSPDRRPADRYKNLISKSLGRLRECEAHESCQQWQCLVGNQSYVPLRLLALEESATGVSLRLVQLRRGTSRSIRYAILSRCWVIKPFTHLTTASEIGFCAGDP